MRYVSVHHHTTYSFMDGYGLPAQHLARTAELGMRAQAVTEHGNVSSHVQHEKEAKKLGVKPLFGLEAYTAREQTRSKWHLTLLAENETGYRNLMRLVTRSWAEGFYQWPTVSGEMLGEHSDGLVVLSGCADSLLACTLLGGKGVEPHPADSDSIRAALHVICQFQDIFGDAYYLEVQQFPELGRTRTLNSIYAELSKKTGAPLVATSDVHYPMPDDNDMQLILHAAGRGAADIREQAEGWEYDIKLTHPASDKAIRNRLLGTGLSRREATSAILNTEEIADRCNVELPKVERLRYPVPNGRSSKDLIWEWLRRGWRYRAQNNKRLLDAKHEYVMRLKYEMDLIEGKDFIDYFLMLSDIVRHAKDKGIFVGPARGSAAASLACYLLRITEVDPLQFPMMFFERFIAHDRYDVPDVDLDFSDDRRREIWDYAIEKYGADRVGYIGTYTKYKGKNALIDVARVNNVPDYELVVVKDLMIERSSGDARAEATLGDTIEMFPQAKAIFNKYPALWNALRLEGNYRGMSVHAAGLVIGNEPLSDNVALYTRTSGSGSKKVTRQVLSVDKYDAEYLGLMKLDALGLATLGMIGHALDSVGLTIDDMYNVPLDDPKVFDAFRANDVTGIFQFSGGSTRIVNGDVKPDIFMELADINALSRPGPLHSGATSDYIDIKHGRKKRKKQHPAMEKLTAWTKGQIIYQEQILAIVRDIGGFDWVHAQEIRKIVSLKHGVASFNMQEPLFLAGAKRLHGIGESDARDIWRRMATAGTYAFNVAHSVSYAMLGYWQMWLKVYHPEAFYAASLRKFPDDQYWLLRDGIKHGITFVPPSRQRSGRTWALDKRKRIVSGFEQLPGIGDSLAEEIIRDREERGPFPDWPSLIRVKGIGPKKLEQMLTAAGTDDPFRIYVVDRLLAGTRAALANGDLGPLPEPTHRAADIPTGGRTRRVVFLGLPTERDSRDVIEDERASTGEDYETIRKRLKSPHLVKRMVVKALDETDVVVYLRWNRFTFPRFQAALWDMKLDHDLVLVRGEKRAGFGTSIYVDQLWVISPD